MKTRQFLSSFLALLVVSGANAKDIHICTHKGYKHIHYKLEKLDDDIYNLVKTRDDFGPNYKKVLVQNLTCSIDYAVSKIDNKRIGPLVQCESDDYSSQKDRGQTVSTQFKETQEVTYKYENVGVHRLYERDTKSSTNSLTLSLRDNNRETSSQVECKH